MGFLCCLPSPPWYLLRPHFHLFYWAHDSAFIHLSILLPHFQRLSLLQSCSFSTSFVPFLQPSHCFILPSQCYFTLLNFFVPTFHASRAIMSFSLSFLFLPLSPVQPSPRRFPDPCLIFTRLKLPSHFSATFLTHPRSYFHLPSYNFILLSSTLSCLPRPLVTLHCHLSRLTPFLPSITFSLSLLFIPFSLSYFLPSTAYSGPFSSFCFLCVTLWLPFSTFSPRSVQASSLTPFTLPLSFLFLQN